MYDITRFNNNYMSVRRVLYYLLAVDDQCLIKNDKKYQAEYNFQRTNGNIHVSKSQRNI